VIHNDDYLDLQLGRWYPVLTMKNDAIHQRLRAVRLALQLTQRQFAKQIGLAQTALCMIELGKNTLTDKVIKLVCAEFSVNEQWLRTGKGQMLKQSPYMSELCDILTNLSHDTQRYLLIMARELQEVEQKLLNKVDVEENTIADADT
jgi:transcriptional regulator with XRE-family HTH domain